MPLAFKLATTTNTPIIPISIQMSNAFMGKNKQSFFPLERIHFHIVFHAPLIPQEHEKPENLLQQAEKVIRQQLRQHI